MKNETEKLHLQQIKEETSKQIFALQDKTIYARVKHVSAYVEALLFSESETFGEVDTLADSAKEKIREWIKTFVLRAESTLIETDYTSEQTGHDLFFTQFRHGVGFWEKDFCNESQGKLLTQFAHELPEFVSFFVNEITNEIEVG